MYQNIVSNQARGASAADGAEQSLMRSISLRDLWAPVYRSRYALIAIFALIFSLAVVATLLIQPRYRSTATVEIRSDTQKVLGTEDRNEATATPNDASLFLDTQLDIIRSRSTAAAVAQSLNLYANDDFLRAMSVDVNGIKVGVLNQQEARRKLVIEVLLNNLKVAFSDETRIAQIKFSSPDPRLAQRIANSYADSYIRLNLARRFDASSYSLDFLRKQIREAQQRLSESERQAIGYARRERLIDASNAAGGSASDTGPQSLTTASLVGLNQALSTAITKRIVAEQRWKVTDSAPLLTIPEVVANPTVQQLQQQRALLQGQYKQELQTRTEEYPTVRQLAARIGEIQKQIDSLARDVKSTIREEYDASLAQEDGLRSTIDRLKSTTLDEQGRSIQLSILRREATTNRQQLDALLRRYNELNAQSGVQLNNLAVIDRAEVPGAAYWPSVPLNIALALVGSILLSAIYIVGRENLFEMVRTPEDVGSRLHLPLLGAVPVAAEIIAAIADPKSAVAEALNSIRTSLSLSSASGIPKSLMVTSTQAGEGKSTTCYGLAQGLAKLGRSVVVVDADLRRPNIHRLFGLSNTAGTSNILSGASSAEEVVHRGLLPHLDVLVAGPIPPDVTELLGAGRLRGLIGELGKTYDHVLVDSAPVLGLADAPLVASNVDCVIYVIESTRNSVRSVQSAIQRVQQSGTPLAGVVLSRFDPVESGYSYEYSAALDYAYGPDKSR